MKLIWNVYCENFSNNKIEVFNIFNHRKFYQEVCDCLKECRDKTEFKEEVRRTLIYYFGYKAEYEIVLVGWPRGALENGRKIDIYQQVMTNYSQFINYIWSAKEEKLI